MQIKFARMLWRRDEEGVVVELNLDFVHWRLEPTVSDKKLASGFLAHCLQERIVGCH